MSPGGAAQGAAEVAGAILAGPRDLLDGMDHTRRMFGVGLPGAWPFAAVALYYLPRFVDRFRGAVRVSEACIEQVTRHEAFAVERMAGGTNLFQLRVADVDAGAFRRRLQARAVELGGFRSDGTVLVGVNETWNRASSPARLAAPSWPGSNERLAPAGSVAPKPAARAAGQAP